MTTIVPSPARVEHEGGTAPSHWDLDDAINRPIAHPTQQREYLLHNIFVARVRREGRSASILANVALRWDVKRRSVGVDPDVMWAEPALPEGTKSLLTWEPGRKPPRVAVEVVSEDTARKDYLEGPEKYDASGTRELWVFDPEGFGPRDHGGPWVLQVWRRVRSGFKRVYAGTGPCFSRELGAWIVVVGDKLRVANDQAGKDLWPTADEEREAAEARAETEAAARREAEAKVRDGERAREALEARLREVEAKLAATTGRKRPRRTPKG